MKNWNPTLRPLRDRWLFPLCLLPAGGVERREAYILYIIMYVADVPRS